MEHYRVSLITDEHNSAEFVLELPDDAVTEDLVSAVKEQGFHGGVIYCNNIPLLPGERVASIGLVHGSRISQRILADDAKPLGCKVVVVTGPEAGRFVELPLGTEVVIGRSSGDLALPSDPVLSQRHLSFRWNGDSIEVCDLGSSNGSAVEGEPLAKGIAQPIELGAYVHAGSSVFTVVNVTDRDLATLGKAAGPAVPFPRTFPPAVAPLRAEFDLPVKSTAAVESDPFNVVRTLLPLVSMGAFFLQGAFRALVLVGPLYIVVDTLRRKKAHQRKGVELDASYETKYAEALSAIASERALERRRDRDARPFGGIATVHALTVHRRLWERRVDDDLFLAVTVGLATRPSAVRAKAQGVFVPLDAGDDLWGMHVDVELRKTGSLGIVGPVDRARGIARGIATALAVTHSPFDVNLWVFADSNTAPEWTFAQWLPHAMNGDVVSRVATTPEGRSDLLTGIKQELARRRVEQGGRNTPMIPAHVFVVDGASLLPSSDLTDLLVHGPSVGMFGIVVDSSLTPDGIMATVRLGSESDRATFESRHQPLISGVQTAEMSTSVAYQAARTMAKLSPSQVGVRGIAAGTRRLIDLLGPQYSSAEKIVAAWNANSPSTSSVVGSLPEANFSVDIVRHGPHGLVSGMSRSGKTEFLKSFIMSLAAINHPDDLNFVIVDFKGGVDYTLARELAHVLEVSSNQDLDRFERTLTMLIAEQDRRQDLFERHGVPNLDAYRVARQRNPEAPPVPRLIVLVDEFGELAASEVGKAQMKRLESITRVGAGLGINLVLITQNFSGTLSDQIEANSGLRLCFRVEKAEHSSVLLGSGVAATLNASNIGRGYARLKGSEPIEFQSARIAGRQPALAAGISDAHAHRRTMANLYQGLMKEEQIDVPAEQTDMFALLTQINNAAKLSGWQQSPIPWPSALPEIETLEHAVAVPFIPGTVPLGVVDLPQRQRQAPHALQFADDHVLLVGGADADLDHALTMVGVSAALGHTPDTLHIYGIDLAGRGLGRLSELPHVGVVATRNDLLALRLLDHLRDEIDRRRSLMAANGAYSIEELRTRCGIPIPHVLLLVSSAERLLPAANSGSVSPLHAPLSSLVSDASGLGVQCVFAASPAFVNYRPGTLISRRLVFKTVEAGEALGLGVPREALGDIDSPHKFYDVQQQCVGVVATVANRDVTVVEAIEALAYRINERGPIAPSLAPKALKEVAWPLHNDQFRSEVGSPPDHLKTPLALGLDGVAGESLWVDAAYDGPTFAVWGERKTGRSNALLSIGNDAVARGWHVIAFPFSRTSPLLNPQPGWTVAASVDDVERICEATTAPCLLLIDDLHRPFDGLRELKPLDNLRFTVVAGTVASITDFRGPLRTLGLREVRNGIALSPRILGDFEPLGLRRDAMRDEYVAVQRAGVGMLGIDSELIAIAMPKVL